MIRLPYVLFRKDLNLGLRKTRDKKLLTRYITTSPRWLQHSSHLLCSYFINLFWEVLEMTYMLKFPGYELSSLKRKKTNPVEIKHWEQWHSFVCSWSTYGFSFYSATSRLLIESFWASFCSIFKRSSLFYSYHKLYLFKWAVISKSA